MNPHHKRFVGADTHEHLAGQPITEQIHMTKGAQVFRHAMRFHAYMESWGLAVDHPYYQLTGHDGFFADGRAARRLYADGLASRGRHVLEKKVTVPAKGSAQADFVFESPKGRRSAHEIEENPHFGPDSLGKTLDIRPTLELQKP